MLDDCRRIGGPTRPSVNRPGCGGVRTSRGGSVGDEAGEEDAAEVGGGVFVVAGCDVAPLLEPVESAFDGVALAIAVGIESRWPAAG